MTLTAKQTKNFKAQLQTMLADLEELSDIAAESRKPVTLDQTSVGRLSRMDALQEQAMQLETERRRENERARIRAALERIESGDFGYCAVCGDDIAIKRLTHDPSVASCVDCASTAP